MRACLKKQIKKGKGREGREEKRVLDTLTGRDERRLSGFLGAVTSVLYFLRTFPMPGTVSTGKAVGLVVALDSVN